LTGLECGTWLQKKSPNTLLLNDRMKQKFIK
jgi:hypothetical protein